MTTHRLWLAFCVCGGLVLAVTIFAAFPPPPFAHADAITWDGSESSDWNDPNNWSGGVVPGSGDDVTVPDTANDPVLSGAVEIAGLTIDADAMVDLSGNSMSVSGTFQNNGTLRVWGTEVVSGLTDADSGTLEYVGVNDSTATDRNLDTVFGEEFYNLHVNTVDGDRPGGSSQEVHVYGDMIVDGGGYTQGTALTVDGNLTLNAGTMYLPQQLTVHGSVELNGGSFSVSYAVPTVIDGDLTVNGGDHTLGASFSVGGNFIANASTTFVDSNINISGDVQVGGGWTPAFNSLTLVGCDQTVTGSFAIGTLTKTDAVNDGISCVLTIGAGDDIAVTGTLNLDGYDADDRLIIASNSPGSHATFDFQGTANWGGGDYLTISDCFLSDNSSVFSLPATPSDSVNGGSAYGWFDVNVTWTGASDTQWGNTANWDMGFVPTEADNVIIPNASTLPIIDTWVSYEMANLNIQDAGSVHVSLGATLTASVITIDAGGTLSLGETATVNGSIENQGTIALAGSATISYSDTDSGLCQYSVATSLSNAPVTNCYDLSIMGGTVQANSFTVANDLYIADGAVLDVTNGAMGASLSVGGSTENAGTIRLSDTTTLTGFSDTDSGLCDYIYGNGGGGGLSYFSECHDVQWTAGGSMTMQLYTNETIAGNLTVDGGNHIACNTPGVTLDVANDVTVSGGGSINCSSVTIDGSLAVSNASLGSGMETNVTVAGDVALASANTSNASLTLNGCNQSVTGDGSWLYFNKTEASDDAASCTLTLGGGSTIDILNGLTLGGLDEDDRLLVVSDTPSTPAIFDMQNASTWSNGEYLTITDNTILDNSSSIDLPLEPANSLNGGNTMGWFVADDDGDGISNDTEGSDDVDGDSIPNYLDPDSDGDGFSDADEYSVNSSDPLTGCTTGTSICEDNDIDDDAVPNYLDTDSDADGISDSDEYSAAAEDPLVSCTE